MQRMFYKTMLKGYIRKTAKTSILFCTILLLVLVFYPEVSEAKEVNLTINGEYLSATLQDASLNTIFEALEREKGIWLKGNLSLLDEKVTVQFTDQSLEDGINRILASINNCLVFESDGSVIGAILFDKKNDKQASVQYTEDANKNTISLQAENKMVNSGSNNEADIGMDGPPVSRSTAGSKQYLKDLEILTNIKSQDAPVKMTPERQLECLEILRDGPSKGIPAKMTPAQIKGLEILKPQPSQTPPI